MDEQNTNKNKQHAMTDFNNIKAVLASVGGSPEPILFTLRNLKPAHVWYFCSEGSRSNADEIHAKLDWHPNQDVIEVAQFEELGPCYGALRRDIPGLLKKWKLVPDEVMVDYTGGTKTMSAALVLAATEVLQNFSYIGGEARGKGGLGVTIDGREKAFYQSNPWSELAIRELERVRNLWDHLIFDEAAAVLRDAATKVPTRMRFEAVADLANAMAARHRLDFSGAVGKLSRLIGKLQLLYDGQNSHGLLELVKSARDICQACAQDAASDVFLRELLDNVLRTAREGRYEDAACRLYRAMEMQGQIWLAEATGSLFLNGRCNKGNATKLPPVLKTLTFCQPDAEGQIKFSLEEVFLALTAIGNERARIVAADLEAKDAFGKTKSRWRAATEKRNTSILGHGTAAIGREGFEQMKGIASEFLGFDLSAQANPIPPLESQWF
jgi:CRISPR-associated protein (TIGR02710 family)